MWHLCVYIVVIIVLVFALTAISGLQVLGLKKNYLASGHCYLEQVIMNWRMCSNNKAAEVLYRVLMDPPNPIQYLSILYFEVFVRTISNLKSFKEEGFMTKAQPSTSSVFVHLYTWTLYYGLNTVVYLLVSFAASDANELFYATSIAQGFGILHVLGDDFVQCTADSSYCVI